MKPISQFSRSEAQTLEGLFFDLDDTFLDEGRVTEAAYRALFRLKESGLRLVALTGRPAAWGELLARMWPVEAAIAENGAVAYVRESARVRAIDSVDAPERERRRAALLELVRAAQVRFPDLIPADDVGGRITDFTFDIGEHQRAKEDTIQAAQEFAHGQGARTTRSSVHLHYTFDRADKATGALGYLCRTGGDPTRGRQRFAFIGDSDNDASAFAAFSHAVGVKNLRGHFSIPPRYLTERSSSDGFVEFAQILTQLRQK
jgi:HAD superfamily hydrolase (TIGR01484 family)